MTQCDVEWHGEQNGDLYGRTKDVFCKFFTYWNLKSEKSYGPLGNEKQGEDPEQEKKVTGDQGLGNTIV